MCFGHAEEARKVKNFSKIPTLSREWLYGSKSRPVSGCTFWYCSNKCNRLIWNFPPTPWPQELCLMDIEIVHVGTWYGQKALYSRVLSFYRNAKWCCWRHRFRTWWGGMYMLFWHHFGTSWTRTWSRCYIGFKTICLLHFNLKILCCRMRKDFPMILIWFYIFSGILNFLITCFWYDYVFDGNIDTDGVGQLVVCKTWELNFFSD